MHNTSRQWMLVGAAGIAAYVAGAAYGQQPFATRVMSYDPACGQLVNNPNFNNPERALGAPVGGGTLSPNNTKLVTLGGFGGSIVLGFDSPVVNQPPTSSSGRNPHGLDLIVFGNPFWVGGNANRRFVEPGTIEVSADVNHNGLPDDPWYLIPGSHLTGIPEFVSQSWDDNTLDPTNPPGNPQWIPPGMMGVWVTTGYLLPESTFEHDGSGRPLPIMDNPNGPDALLEGFHGYADCTPTMPNGDTPPERFYTVPDDPFVVGISAGSAGGDAIDISWAVDETSGVPAGLQSIDFVRITTAANFVSFFGEVSTEIGGVARVILPPRSDWDGDGQVVPQDVAAYVNAWFADLINGTTAADFDGDGATTPADVAAFVAAWFLRE